MTEMRKKWEVESKPSAAGENISTVCSKVWGCLDETESGTKQITNKSL